MGIMGTETVTVNRRVLGEPDSYGNPTLDYVHVDIPRCLIAWGASTESSDLFGMSVDTKATIQFPPNTPIKKNDTFVLPNGKTYVQEGAPVYWKGQRGNPIKQKVLVNVVLKEGGSDA